MGRFKKFNKAVVRLTIVFGLLCLWGCDGDDDDSDVSVIQANIFRSQAVSSLSGGSRPFGIHIPADIASIGVIVTHQDTNGTLSILRNVGDGTFTIGQMIQTVPLAPMGSNGIGRGVVSADFDGDGDLDLVMADTVEGDTLPLCDTVPNSRLTFVPVFINNNGVFALGQVLTGGLRAQTPGVGDFNGDGNIDIVLGNRHGERCVGTTTVPGLDISAPNPNDRRNGIGNVQLFLGDGTGNFADAGFFGTCTSGHFLAVADFNEDGRSDVAIPCNIDFGGVAVLFGQADGTLAGQIGLGLADGTTSRPHHVKTADLNGDGNMDIAAANTKVGQPAVTVFLGDGEGGFSDVPGARFSLGELDDLRSPFLEIADVTGRFSAIPDGILDLIVVKSTGDAAVLNQIVILAGQGDGNFMHVTNLGSPFPVAQGLNIRQIAVTDVNGDNLPDVVATAFGTGGNPFTELMVLLHN